ncbi:MAG: hypothetical protein AMXMBFR82_06810 [Candidatus Hydrogenedentota bacterium]
MGKVLFDSEIQRIIHEDIPQNSSEVDIGYVDSDFLDLMDKLLRGSDERAKGQAKSERLADTKT